jgi:hypothetical protein
MRTDIRCGLTAATCSPDNVPPIAPHPAADNRA